MGQAKGQFRFLDEDEFGILSSKDKAVYLFIASQELETRQRQLREHVRKLLARAELESWS